MLYDVKTLKEYMESLDLDWRKEKLQELRNIILKQDAKITESINYKICLLYTSPSPRDKRQYRMPSSA